MLSLEETQAHIVAIQHSNRPVYDQLNTLRDWVNAHFGPQGFELYLEDVWNEHVPGETHFEYILRSKRTLNETTPIGVDVYTNHQDAKGVWHLGDYQSSRWLMTDPAPLLAFLMAEGGFSG
jgi:hypothetical protein